MTLKAKNQQNAIHILPGLFFYLGILNSNTTIVGLLKRHNLTFFLPFTSKLATFSAVIPICSIGNLLRAEKKNVHQLQKVNFSTPENTEE